jgi:hypothetical protein
LARTPSRQQAAPNSPPWRWVLRPGATVASPLFVALARAPPPPGGGRIIQGSSIRSWAPPLPGGASAQESGQKVPGSGHTKPSQGRDLGPFSERGSDILAPLRNTTSLERLDMVIPLDELIPLTNSTYRDVVVPKPNFPRCDRGHQCVRCEMHSHRSKCMYRHAQLLLANQCNSSDVHVCSGRPQDNVISVDHGQEATATAHRFASSLSRVAANACAMRIGAQLPPRPQPFPVLCQRSIPATQTTSL